MNLPHPYAFNYHFDNGVFRGLAFANFTTSDETQIVIEHMSHFELQGRKLRVEYKKMLPLQERERIEREKRERGGQLEEQHRSTSTKKLASGAPSSPEEHGIGSNDSPILRSRGKLRVWGSPFSSFDSEEDSYYHTSPPNLVGSSKYDHFLNS
ncbi:MAG: hypothetical protein Q9221_008029 [Calogaya cf. arnoldii]